MSDHHNLRVPAWCPQCSLPMKGHKSTMSFYDYGVCMNCFIEFIEHREQRWKDGWRPNEEQLKAFAEKIS